MLERIFALTTRGLEGVTAAELSACPDVLVENIAYRRVTASCSGSLAPLLYLRTVDDVFLDLAAWSRVGPHRSTLRRLFDMAKQLDLNAAVATCARVRSVSTSLAFSISVSFVGRRNYNTAEIKTVVADALGTTHNWRYEPDDSVADLSLRLFIVHETAFVGLRIGKTPLHEREYKLIHRAGSLKATVAAGMLRLIGTAPGHYLLDPCCGVGTFLVEAARLGAKVTGGDSDAAAVVAARSNTKAAGLVVDLTNWDIRELPFPDASIDRIVSNLPWGRQVRIDAERRSFFQETCKELRRVLAPHGRIAILTNNTDLLQFEDLCEENKIEISLFGQTPTIMIFSAERLRPR